MSISIYGLDVIQRRLHAIGGVLTGTKPILTEIGEATVESTKLRFKSSGPSPDGVPWKPLSASTIRNRRKGKGTGSAMPLLDTGRLRNSITKRVDSNSVFIGTNVEYAAVHQFGASAYHPPQSRMVRLRVVKGRTRFAKDSHKKARTVWGTNSTGWTVNIPARPYLGFSNDDQAEIIGIIQRRINEAGAA